MAKKIRISEAQYKQILKEGVAINLPLTQNKEIDRPALQRISDQMGGADATVTADVNKILDTSSNSTTTIATESHNRLITKKELQSNRLRYLKENSEVLSLNNFMKRLH